MVYRLEFGFPRITLSFTSTSVFANTVSESTHFHSKMKSVQFSVVASSIKFLETKRGE